MDKPEDRVLDVRDLAVEFSMGDRTNRVVDGISFSVGQRERYALVGESGSGKTVTALSVLRLNDETRARYPSGSIRFDGHDLLAEAEVNMLRVRGGQIGMIFQEPMTSLNPLHTIGAQLTEPLMIHMGLSRDAARRHAVELLERTRIPDAGRRLDAYPHMLSGGQRQRVMIAMALACRPRLLIADEPTTALDVTIQAQIIELLEDLQRDFDMAILMITHDLNLVRRFAHRIGVMQQGRLVEQGDAAQILAAPQHPYTRRLLDSEPKPLMAESLKSARLLEAEAMRCTFAIKGGPLRRKVGEVKAVDDVTFDVRIGETVGIVGESGSGKTTLGMCVIRLQDCTGSVMFDGRSLTDLSQRELRPLRRDFQVVFQDPFSSLSPRMTVEGIVGEGLRVHFPAMDQAERRHRIVAALEEVGLSEDMLWRYPHEFSGGQRQRIAIARAAILEPKLILLDEPTSALDVSVQKQVLDLLRELQRRRGLSYLFISHDLRVIRAISHRILVMQHGRVVEQGDTEALFAAPREAYTRTLLSASLFASAGAP